MDGERRAGGEGGGEDAEEGGENTGDVLCELREHRGERVVTPKLQARSTRSRKRKARPGRAVTDRCDLLTCPWRLLKPPADEPEFQVT